MIRGTEAQFQFNFPYNCCDVSGVSIVFWQETDAGDIGLTISKNLSHCSVCGEKTVSVTLNQDETLRFSSKKKGHVQMHATLNNGTHFASLEELFTVYPLYNDSMEEEALPDPDSSGVIILDGYTIE